MGLFLLIASATNVLSQSSFSKTKKEFDSIASRIDSDKTLTVAISEGSTEDEAGFSFNFYIYFKKELRTVFKATYSGSSLQTTFNTFYYMNNKLIKIISDGVSYYYIQNVLYNTSGIVAGKTISNELVELSNIPLQGMDQFFKRMKE